MVDDLMESALPDSNRIDVEHNRELKYWSQLFGVSEQQLKRAVRTVGSSAHAVREYFEKRQGARQDTDAPDQTGKRS
jgi:hypothetical protein